MRGVRHQLNRKMCYFIHVLEFFEKNNQGIFRFIFETSGANGYDIKNHKFLILFSSEFSSVTVILRYQRYFFNIVVCKNLFIVILILFLSRNIWLPYWIRFIFYLFFSCTNFYLSFSPKMFSGSESILLGKRTIILDSHLHVTSVN